MSDTPERGAESRERLVVLTEAIASGPADRVEWVGAGGTSDPDRTRVLQQLGDATRELIDAVVETDVDDEAVLAAAAEIARVTETLRGRTRPPTMSMAPQAIRDRFIAYNPVIGVVNPFAPPLDVEIDADGVARARVKLTRVHEGPPNAVHGGIVALLIDQLLGHAVGTAGQPGMTVRLTVNYRKPTPYDRDIVVEAWHVETNGRRVIAGARIIDDEGTLYAESDALFLVLKPEQRLDLLRGDEESPIA